MPKFYEEINQRAVREIAGIVFRNLVLDKVSKDELLTSKEKEARIYRAGYHIELKDKNIRPKWRNCFQRLETAKRSSM